LITIDLLYYPVNNSADKCSEKTPGTGQRQLKKIKTKEKEKQTFEI
jgi:hypothetical protein